MATPLIPGVSPVAPAHHPVARTPVRDALVDWLIAKLGITIDGTTVPESEGKLTIDGANVTEVTVDGTTVWKTGFPDGGALHSHFAARLESFSDGASVGTVADQSGNGHNLTQGTAADQPSYQTGVINSESVFRFNDDYVDAGFTAISQPYTIFAVVKDSDNTSFGTVLAARDAQVRFQGGDGDYWRVNAGSLNIDGGANDGASFYIWTIVYNGSNSFARQDGTQVISGDPGGNSLDGLRLGENESNLFPLNGDIAEIAIYPDQRSTSQINDVEGFLSGIYGIAV